MRSKRWVYKKGLTLYIYDECNEYQRGRAIVQISKKDRNASKSYDLYPNNTKHKKLIDKIKRMGELITIKRKKLEFNEPIISTSASKKRTKLKGFTFGKQKTNVTKVRKKIKL